MPTTLTTPTAAEAPVANGDLDRMLPNGRWTHGRRGQSFEDVDPYMNDVWLRIPLADHAALDDALAAVGGRAETRRATWNRDLKRSSTGLFIWKSTRR